MDTFEPPKYIQSLIASINDGAKSAQLGALAFVAIGLVLLATAFSATDEDLLLNRSITVSQLGGAQVPVVLSFGLAPAVFVAVHLYTLMRYDMLAANIRRFRDDLAAMVRLEADRERCRQLLANVEFVQVLIAPKGSAGSNIVFRWAVWFVLAVFPIFVLLLVQLSSLRLQNEVVNWVHHAAIIIDLGLVGWFAWRLPGRTGLPWTNGHRPRIAIVPVCAVVVVLVSDLAWMRVPSADATTVGGNIRIDVRWPAWELKLDGIPPIDRPIHAVSAAWGYAVAATPPLGSWIAQGWRQPVDLILCGEARFGCRYLTVSDRPIVAHVWDKTRLVEMRAGDEVNFHRRAAVNAAVLTGRTIRFTDLRGSQLFSANLDGADLRSANLTGTNLKGASLARASLQGAFLDEASLQGASARQVHLWNATITSTTNLALIDLRDADFEQVDAPMVEKIVAGVPELAKASVRDALSSSTERSIHGADTAAGPVLIDADETSLHSSLAPGQLAEEPAIIATPLARYLAHEIAPSTQRAAIRVAGRLQAFDCDRLRDALLDSLRERLLEHVKSNKIILPDDTLAMLKRQTRSCSPLPVAARSPAPSQSWIGQAWNWLWAMVAPGSTQ